MLLLTAFFIGTLPIFVRTISVVVQLQDGPSNTTHTIKVTIPNAQLVYQTESISLPHSVGTFVWYIVDEAHENTVTPPWKHVSDHNPVYIPTSLTIHVGTAITFLDADAPWDTPPPHTISIINSNGKVVYITGRMDYTNSSGPKVLPADKYTVHDTKYSWIGNLTIVPNQRPTGNLIVGGFYTPTNQVTNNKITMERVIPVNLMNPIRDIAPSPNMI